MQKIEFRVEYDDKKKFVGLFAGVMNDIFTNEKEKELEKNRQNYDNRFPWEEEELNTVRIDFGSGARSGITTGGSKKKSNKRIRRKRRDSRRNKTRKYKKRN